MYVSPSLLLAALVLLGLVIFLAYRYGQRQAAPTMETLPDEPSNTTEHDDNMARNKKSKPEAVQPSADKTGSTANTSGSDEINLRSWGYQLQKLNLKQAAGSPFDVLVIDYSRDGSDEKALKPAEIDKLKRKPGGGRRLVLAYMSIGEAEDYRFYWNESWKNEPPAWLLGENPEWEGNYAVGFWDQGWKQVIFGTAGSYLDRLVALGFDGVYLDKCDVVDDLRESYKDVARTRKNLEGDMVAFVAELSAYAKKRLPGFLITMQNAESLLENQRLRGAIDMVAKESLIFGESGEEQPNAQEDFDEMCRLLNLARDDSKPVLVVEYLDNPELVVQAQGIATELGYVLFISPKDRELASLAYDVPVA